MTTAYIWHKENLTTALLALNPVWHGDFLAQSTCIITDTRNLKTGDVFLAIVGERFDGHHFVDEAQKKGASLLIVSQAVESTLPQLIVSDTKKALGLLGKYRRDAHDTVQVIALTGSSGKTSTKEMLGAILSPIAPTLITEGNLNNDLGVPMMLLKLRKEHRFLVLELGANHLGEIAYTTHLASPDVACVLNIGTAHLGEFGGQHNIARAKAEIFDGLQVGGTAVLPYGDDFFVDLHQKAQNKTAHIITTGERTMPTQEALDMTALSQAEQDALADLDVVQVMGDVFADEVEVVDETVRFVVGLNVTEADTPTYPIVLPMAGAHNVQNALSAIACALALGVDIQDIVRNIQTVKPPKGRLNFIPWNSHILIDDTYNANVPAMLAAAQVLLAQKQSGAVDEVWMVIGDIGELGEQGIDEHQKLGSALAQMGIDRLFCVGKLMQYTHQSAQDNGVCSTYFAQKSDIAPALQANLAQVKRAAILFKGSRFMRMETVLESVQNDKLS